MKTLTRLFPILLILTLLLTACSGTNDTKPYASMSAASTSSEPSSSSAEARSSAPEEPESLSPEELEFLQETKMYLLEGQADLPEADQLKWSELFLEEVDFESVYQTYRSADGPADDREAFALYLTEHAPITTDWKELFEAELWNQYQVTASRYEPLEGENYQVYVELDDGEVPYVVVNARTGYFHG